MRDKMPRKGGRWWFSWRGRNTTIKEVSMENKRVFLLSSSNLGVLFSCLCVREISISHNTEVSQASTATKQGKASQNVGKVQRRGRRGFTSRPCYLAGSLWPSHCSSGISSCVQRRDSI